MLLLGDLPAQVTKHRKARLPQCVGTTSGVTSSNSSGDDNNSTHNSKKKNYIGSKSRDKPVFEVTPCVMTCSHSACFCVAISMMKHNFVWGSVAPNSRRIWKVVSPKVRLN